MADRNAKQAAIEFWRYSHVCSINIGMCVLDQLFLCNWNGGGCLSALQDLVRPGLDDEGNSRAVTCGSLPWVT